ncbi:MAG: aldo/keto reductase [Pseudomonadales bacterium]|nr:aldo/keto reductase [Pseudomonadales bacterium]
MKTRKLGPFTVNAIGLGCMSMSHAYGTPDEKEAEKALHHALDVGYNFLDTAALYGFGKNESLIGRVLKDRRQEFVLASKAGMFKDENGKRKIDARPEVLKQTCDEALKRLQTDVIDLYYLHRWDRKVPVEDSIGALADLVQAGKVRALGLSEVSAATLRRAHAVHPIAALQTEYSLWSRNPEIAVLNACKEIGAAFVAFSPLARQFLTGKLTDPATQLEASDLRHNMPRFQAEHYPKNLALLTEYRKIAEAEACTMAQLALAWLLAKDTHIIPIPGSRHALWVEENFGALELDLSPAAFARLDQLINQHTVSGPRYNATTQAEVDTEEF